MGKGRLEAFSDGVLAIIITIMVLELTVPARYRPLGSAPTDAGLLSYVLSFVYLGIYWNNHHHMLHVAQRVTGGILWANLHLLFWLSLVPFVTAWMGENHLASTPTALYGVVLLMAAVVLLGAAAADPARGRAAVRPGHSSGQRPQREDLPSALPGGHRSRVRAPLAGACRLRFGCTHVVDS